MKLTGEKGSVRERGPWGGGKQEMGGVGARTRGREWFFHCNRWSGVEGGFVAGGVHGGSLCLPFLHLSRTDGVPRVHGGEFRV